MQEENQASIPFSVLVVNSAHDGYCRAGYRLVRGENSLPSVTEAQRQLLEGDPRLTVYVIEDPLLPPQATNDDKAGNVGADVAPTVVGGEANVDDGTVKTPMPDDIKPVGEQVPPPADERMLAAVMACQNEPREKWFTKAGKPRLEQWREFVRADLTADDITTALTAHGIQ